jgi:hypothetical protein
MRAHYIQLYDREGEPTEGIMTALRNVKVLTRVLYSSHAFPHSSSPWTENQTSITREWVTLKGVWILFVRFAYYSDLPFRSRWSPKLIIREPSVSFNITELPFVPSPYGWYIFTEALLGMRCFS